MKRLMQLLVWLILIVIMSIDQSSAQKLFEGYWEQTTVTESTLPGTPERESKKQQVYYKSGKMKTVDENTGDMIIFRLDKELMWQVDKNSGTYTEVKFSDMKAGMEKVSEARKQMQQQMKNMSPQEREMMEKMMGKMGGIMGSEEGMKMTVKKTTDTKTINGFKCTRVILYSNNQPLVNFWMTDKYELGSEFLDVYKKLGLFQGEISAEEYKIVGFPIQSQFRMETGAGEMETITNVMKIFPKAISDSEFDLPGGLKKQTMPVVPEE